MSWAPEHRALIVEPITATSRLLADQLRLAGFTSMEIADPQSRGEQWIDEPYGLVVVSAAVEPRLRRSLIGELRSLGPVVVILLVSRESIPSLDVEDVDHLLPRPVELEQLSLVLRIAVRQLAERWQAQAWREQLDHFERHLSMPAPGWCAVGQESSRVARLIPVAADANGPVLLHGEVGAGKEFVARLIHQRSVRAGGAFVRFDPTTLPEPTALEVLTGMGDHDRQREPLLTIPLLELARGGTLYVSEAGALGESLQAALLSVLQNRGGASSEHAGHRAVRVVASTALELPELQRRLRSDLFWQLTAFPIEVPPLSARREDLPALIDSFLAEICSRRGQSPPRISRDAQQALLSWQWPGNIRELRNALEYAVRLCDGHVLAARDLPAWLNDLPAGGASTRSVSGRPTNESRERALARRHVVEALQKSGGNRTQAAQLLGISRVALWKRMRKLDLQFPTQDELSRQSNSATDNSN